MAETLTAVKKERNSTIELLRILCMLAVIAHHCVVHGGSMGMEPCANKYIASFILPLGKISFTCFVAISMWFLVDQKFKASRFLRAWFEVLFYTVIMLLPSFLLGVQVDGRDVIGSFLPIGGNSHGFAATYLVFYLFLPLLNLTAGGFTKKQTTWLIGVLLYIQVFETVFGKVGILPPEIHPFQSEILLFALCFYVSLYLKRWPPKITVSFSALILVMMGTWLFSSFLTIRSWSSGGGGVGNSSPQYWQTMKIVCSICCQGSVCFCYSSDYPRQIGSGLMVWQYPRLVYC